MINKTEYRVSQVLVRTKKHCQQKEKYILLLLSSCCFLLTVGLGGLFSCANDGLQLTGSFGMETYGAMLLRSGRDVYVVIGVLAFVAGVVFTALCLWVQQQKCHNNDSTTENYEGEKK